MYHYLLPFILRFVLNVFKLMIIYFIQYNSFEG